MFHDPSTRNLTAKTKWMIQECLVGHDFDFLIKADLDTAIWPNRIEWSNYKDKDYIGNHNNPPLSAPYNFYYAIGGFYILSWWAASTVALAEIKDIDLADGGWAEDRFIGRVMHEHKVHLLKEERIVFSKPFNQDRGDIAWHGPERKQRRL